MYIRVKTTPNSPRKSVQLVESVRDGTKVRQKIIRHIGVAMDATELLKLRELGEFIKAQIKQDIQPSLFSAEETAKQVIEAKNITAAKKNSKQEPPKKINVDLQNLREQKRTISGIHDIYGKLFDEIGLNELLTSKKSNKPYQSIFKDLVLARIANPSSKRGTVDLLERSFGISIPLQKAYRAMDKLDKKKISNLKDTVFLASKKLFTSNLKVMFFDCTTLYFESFTADSLKSNGYSKDGKFNQPQVLLALLVSEDGLPVGYEVFPGSTFEGHTLKIVMDDLKSRYCVDDIVFVADRGMLSRNNLDYLESNSINYIVGGKLKSLPKTQKSLILNKKATLLANDKSSSCYEFDYKDRRWVVSYDPIRAERDKKNREKAIAKLTKKLGKNTQAKALLNNSGHHKYLKIEGKNTLSIDIDKVEQDAQWDGLHAVVTSLKSAKAAEVFGHYRGLWQVEESFRITKHDLKIRPIFHWTEDRVRAHLAISFAAFSLVRFLCYRVKLQYKKLSAEVIRTNLLAVQHSILLDTETKKHYCIPSKLEDKAIKIYKIMGITYSEIPFTID